MDSKSKRQIIAQITKLQREGTLLQKRLGEYADELRQDGRHISVLKTTRFWGLIFTGGAVLLFIAAFILNYMTFSSFGFASIELAFVISISAFLAFELCIRSFTAWYWEGSQKHIALFVLAGLVVISIAVAQAFLGYIRGGFVEEAALVKPGLLSFVFPLLTVGVEFAGAIACHEGLSYLLSAARPINLHRKIRKGEEKLIQIAFQIDELKGELEGSEDTPEKEAHERKAVLKKIVIALLAIAVVLVYVGFSLAGETECRVILLDLSGSSAAKDRSDRGTEFEKNINTALNIIREQKKSGRVFVAGITDESFSNPMVILNRRLPEPGLFGEKLEFEKKRAAKEFQTASKHLKPVSAATDIFGALALAGDLFGQSCQDKRLYILSDMRHAARGIDIENVSLIPLGTVSKAFQRGMVPRLDGVKVFVTGVHTIGKDERYMESLKRFWQAYFKKAGADFQTFSNTRETGK